jgi:hypothetical protein
LKKKRCRKQSIIISNNQEKKRDYSLSENNIQDNYDNIISEKVSIFESPKKFMKFNFPNVYSDPKCRLQKNNFYACSLKILNFLERDPDEFKQIELESQTFPKKVWYPEIHSNVESK